MYLEEVYLKSFEKSAPSKIFLNRFKSNLPNTDLGAASEKRYRISTGPSILTVYIQLSCKKVFN